MALYVKLLKMYFDKERPKEANEERTALESKPDPPIWYVYFRRERGAHGSKEHGVTVSVGS